MLVHSIKIRVSKTSIFSVFGLPVASCKPNHTEITAESSEQKRGKSKEHYAIVHHYAIVRDGLEATTLQRIQHRIIISDCDQPVASSYCLQPALGHHIPVDAPPNPPLGGQSHSFRWLQHLLQTSPRPHHLRGRPRRKLHTQNGTQPRRRPSSAEKTTQNAAE